MPHIPPSLGLNMGRCMVILGVKSKCNVCSANTRMKQVETNTPEILYVFGTITLFPANQTNFRWVK